jgi:hypothetical protein
MASPTSSPIVAFASTNLTGRAERTTRLRFVLSTKAVVQLRVTRRGIVARTRRIEYRAGGRKGVSLGRLRAGTYVVRIAATNGAARSVDRATLRVLAARPPT